MGHRLSKIYTRTGDQGTTGLADGSRVAKHSARVEAIGALDETNSAIGFLLTQQIQSEHTRSRLIEIQHRLFDAGAELSLPGHAAIDAEMVTEIEAWLDELNADLPPLKEFVLPGGNAAAAACHMARAAARRAERSLWRLETEDNVSHILTAWINRLSDYLFVVARSLARQDGGTEPTWQPRLERPAK